MLQNNIRGRLTLLLLSVIFFACGKDVSIGNKPHSAGAQTLLNVSYGSDVMQNMDVYLPAGRTTASTKSMIMIHGGGWNSGDKADFASFVDTMKRRLPDYAIFNLDYRLSDSPNNVFPAQEMDIKSAIEFIFNKSAEYQLSDKYVLIGASAGGHLAMLQGYKYSAPVKIKAIVSFYGPSNLADMYYHPVVGNTLISSIMALAIGKTPAQDPQIYASSSPVNFINATSPPTILLHGGMDILVNPLQSTQVIDSLQKVGVNNQYVFYPTAGHDVWTNALLFDAFNKIQSFLVANVP